MHRSFLLKLTVTIFMVGIGIAVSQSASAALFGCRFSCIRRLPQNLVCCSRPDGSCPAPPPPPGRARESMGSVTEAQVREWARLEPGDAAAAGYVISPVYYSVIERSVRLESASADVCSTACRAACISECGPALSSGGEPTGEQSRCLDASPVPSFVNTDTAACRNIVGGGALATTLLSSRTAPVPSCVPADVLSDTPIAGPASGAACNPPPIPANAPAKKCVFYCLQPGTGTTGDGRATVETGETSIGLGSGGQTCLNVNAVRRVGTRACSTQGECACVDECKSTCGSEGGKTRCFLGSGNPEQILACPGAGTIGQARSPVCTQEVTDGSPRTLTNPLRTTDIGELIARFIRALSGIAGSMALLMFVVGGVMWMTAEGSDRVQTAQTILKNSTVGILLIFFAYSIVSLFLSVLGL